MERRAVIYTRVSDPSQIENNSLETQLKVCESFSKSKGYEVVKVFTDEGKSAKHVYTRAELRKLISFCCVKSNRIDALIVYKFDRFSRNTEEGLATISLLAKYKVQVLSATENFEDNPIGKAIRSIILAVGQLDNEVKGERVKDNMQAVFRKGLWPFKCPIGYKRPFRTKEESKGKPAVIDPNLGPIITQMFINASTGIYNKTQLARMMNLAGFGDHYRAKASHKIVDDILKRTFYYGYMFAPKWNEYAWGKHEKLIDKDTWEKSYQKVIMKKKNYKFQDVDLYPLKGKLMCEHCGKPLTTSPSKGKTRIFYYYECRNKSCRSVRIEAKQAHDKFLMVLNAIRPSERVLKLFDHMVFAEWDKTISDAETQAEKVEIKISKLKEDLKSIRRSVDSRLMTENEGKEQAEENRKEIALLGIERSDIRIDQYDKEIIREFTKHFLLNLDKLWDVLDLSKRQALLTHIFPNGITCNKNREIRTPELSPSFNLIQSLSAEKGENVTL